MGRCPPGGPGIRALGTGGGPGRGLVLGFPTTPRYDARMAPHNPSDSDPGSGEARAFAGEAHLPQERSDSRRDEPENSVPGAERQDLDLGAATEPRSKDVHFTTVPDGPPGETSSGASFGHQAYGHAVASGGETDGAAVSHRAYRAKRRARDARAEKKAVQVVLVLLLGLATVALTVANLLMDDLPETEGADVAPRAPTPKPLAAAPKTKRPKVFASGQASPDIPALRRLTAEGLTITAEGLPEVLVNKQSRQASLLAAIETCRFAYAVWEFSPNKRFRFLTTCDGFQGEVLVGAYEVDGAVVRMSPLISGPAQILSEFVVEKPAELKSTIAVGRGAQRVQLTVKQRVSSIRTGLAGDQFRNILRKRNTLRPRLEPSSTGG